MSMEDEKLKLTNQLIHRVRGLTPESAYKAIEVYTSFARYQSDGKPAFVILSGIVTEVKDILNVQELHGADYRKSLQDVLANPYYGIDSEIFSQVDAILHPLFYGESKSLEASVIELSKPVDSMIEHDHSDTEILVEK